MPMLTYVSVLSCVFGTLCLLVYLYLVLTTAKRPSPQPQGDRADSVRPQGAVADMAKLVEALAKLADSLQRAGPMIASLIGAIFFLLLAALTAGLAK